MTNFHCILLVWFTHSSLICDCMHLNCTIKCSFIIVLVPYSLNSINLHFHSNIFVSNECIFFFFFFFYLVLCEKQTENLHMRSFAINEIFHKKTVPIEYWSLSFSFKFPQNAWRILINIAALIDYNYLSLSQMNENKLCYDLFKTFQKRIWMHPFISIIFR